MNQDLALRVLGQVMNWDEAHAREEFNWLRVISQYKYDGYRGFFAGARFVENLVYWLQQFKPYDREIAYNFVRQHLIYIDGAQMEHLVELIYPEIVQRRLLSAVSKQLGIPTYRVWAISKANDAYNNLLRRSLFFGLSDGARMDVFRRANAGTISNEQVVVATEINKQKWDSLLDNLQNEIGDHEARFAFVFLLDDFTASGTTLLRKQDGEWKGKLKRFWDQSQEVIETHFSKNWVLCVHHCIGTDKAKKTAYSRNTQAAEEIESWFKHVEFTYSMVLSNNLRVSSENHPDFIQLLNKYYNPNVETQHFAVAGDPDVRLGFGNCALPIVLEYNTPNNSFALLWSSVPKTNENPEMRPLFERRQRHI